MLALGALAFAGCGAPSEPAEDASRDAPEDSSSADAIADVEMSAPDARLDSSLDATTTDSGADNGDPGWVEIPDLPDRCGIERARHPERLFIPAWRECGDGCTYLAQDPTFELHPTTAGGVSSTLEVTFVTLTPRPHGLGGPIRIVAAVGTDGRVHAAWRESRRCSIGGTTYSDGWVAFAIRMIVSRDNFEYAAIFHGRLEEMTEDLLPVLTLGPDDLPGFGNALQGIRVSETTVAFQVQPIGEVWLIEGGALRRLAGVRSEVPGSPQGVALVGRRALWNEWRQDVRIAHGTFEEPAAPYFGVDGARVIFETDGTDLVWFQGYGWDGSGNFTRTQLWAAPFVDDPADLRPRLVVDDFTGSWGSVVGGNAWVEQHGGVLRLVELDSGVLKVFPSPARGHTLGRPAWATATEVAILGLWDGTRTFFRFERRIAEPIE